MRGDSSNVLDALLTRRSVAALKLGEPGPSAAQIETAIAAALRAPDHNNLKPWRCVLIRGEARKRLSELLYARMREREPQTPEAKLEKVRNNPLAAPLVIAIGARIRQDRKVPEQEQLLSCGAATMNLQNAFYAQGFASIWLTGGNAYDAQVIQALGFAADERCLGFVYVGTGAAPDSLALPVNYSEHVREWKG
jgi:nitroreductase